jgi:hypothetical protein
MHERDADTRAEKPGPPARAGGGTAEGSGLARQACAGPTEAAGDESLRLMDKVVSRENLLRAYRRVVRNQGAPGVDGMTVAELWGFSQKHWPGIRERLLRGTYQPRPVRKVEIPKPGGSGSVAGLASRNCVGEGWSGPCGRLHLERTRPVVERGRRSHEPSRTGPLVEPPGPREPCPRVSTSQVLGMNRRIRNRTYGGVGGGGK